MATNYTPSTALVAVSGVFLGLGAACALVIAIDIIWRKGWRSMMGVMIPVYIINAAYMLPVAVYLYFKYGRPDVSNPNTVGHEGGMHDTMSHVDHAHHQEPVAPQQDGSHSPTGLTNSLGNTHSSQNAQYSHTEGETKPSFPTSLHDHDHSESAAAHDEPSTDVEKGTDDMGHHHHHHDDSSRPMWATVLVGVSHCGAGCVLGDVVGEFIVYGSGATINGESIWVELLVDYAFALLFGIAFQYFSIAPMSGDYSIKSVWRAAKADFLSLTSFEVGAFGWMIAFQVGIWNYKLSMISWTYWWMMQVGMFLGYATAVPMNYYLIGHGIKEPCA